jgi:hypothetical protein
MNRYYFNFCNGEELSRDEVGMYLPNLDAAKEEATRVCQDLVAMEQDLSESAIQIADAGGELLFTVPCAE